MYFFTGTSLFVDVECSENMILTTSYEYDADGRLKKETAPDGVVTEYSYDEAGNRIMTTVTGKDGESRTEITRYSRLGDISYEQDAKGNKTHYTYDNLGNLVKVQDAAGGITLYAYDRAGNKTAEVSPNNYVDGADISAMSRLEYTYNYMGKVTSVTEVDCSGEVPKRTRVAYYDYDENGNLLELTDANGNTTVYTYTDSGLVETVLTAETAAAGKAFTTKYTYDALGRVLTEENALGGKVTYTYDGRNQLLTVEQTVGGAVVSKTEYTYDANGNQLSEIKTENGTMITVLANTYDLRNQLVRSKTLDTVINNTYNAAGYRVGKSVTKDGKTTETYFLYDGGSVIMEADASGEVTAKNTYGGPLLMRTVFGEEETTYEYLYNAHGDVVTLLTDSEVTATYYYDAFGNILTQTGEADNSILYAGYQYDEETGLYYVNARMYDPVTARFLQADTYLGNQADPLSLNLYTYCLNNPERYVDPSGHFALELAAILVTAVVLGMIIDIAVQKFVEQKVCIDLDRTITEAAQDMAHQYFIEGKTLSQINYRRVGTSAALGAVISTGSTGLRPKCSTRNVKPSVYAEISEPWKAYPAPYFC